MYIVLTISVLCMVVCLVVLTRNEAVFIERLRVLQIVHERALKAGNNWKKEFEIMNRYSYHEMLWKFWRPVKSFYYDVT